MAVGGLYAPVVGVGLPRGGVKPVDEHRVELSVAVEVHRPDKLNLVVLGVEHLVFKVEVEEQVFPLLLLEQEGVALAALNTVADGGHRQFRTVGNDAARGLEVGLGDGLGVHLGVVLRPLCAAV